MASVKSPYKEIGLKGAWLFKKIDPKRRKMERRFGGAYTKASRRGWR